MKNFKFSSQYLAKVAEDKEPKKIDTISALATAGGAVGGGLGAASLGELVTKKILEKRPGSVLADRYSHTIQRLSDAKYRANLAGKIFAQVEPSIRPVDRALTRSYIEAMKRRDSLKQSLDHRHERVSRRSYLLGKLRDKVAIPSGLTGALLGGTAMYTLTKPATRDLLAKVLDK